SGCRAGMSVRLFRNRSPKRKRGGFIVSRNDKSPALALGATISTFRYAFFPVLAGAVRLVAVPPLACGAGVVAVALRGWFAGAFAPVDGCGVDPLAGGLALAGGAGRAWLVSSAAMRCDSAERAPAVRASTRRDSSAAAEISV